MLENQKTNTVHEYIFPKIKTYRNAPAQARKERKKEKVKTKKTCKWQKDKKKRVGEKKKRR